MQIINQAMKQKYNIRNIEEPAFASEQEVQTSRMEDLRNQLVSRVMEIDDPKTLQSLILYFDKTVLNTTNSFDAEWERAISVEDFRKQCHSKLKDIYG